MQIGLIGYPVKHSISPAFQQAAFDALGLDVRYELWETPAERLSSVIQGLRQEGRLGANVTIPYKQVVLGLLDRVDPLAATIGAVNTIVRRPDGSLEGYNTDVDGFVQAIEADGRMPLQGAQLVLLGAGGAARAVVAGALRAGADAVVICARRLPPATAIVDDLRRGGIANGRGRVRVVALSDGLSVAEALRESQILVNATPVGMDGHGPADTLPVPSDYLHEELLVCDLIYRPPATPLLRAAAAIGARTLNGLPMLVYQGAAAFERWTGRSAPIELMRRKAQEALDV